MEAGKLVSLQTIHRVLFEDIYDFAGKIRTVNLAKGSFRFAPLMYLTAALQNFDKMPQSNFDQIVEKYVEMNIAHPFRDGNGRTGRLLVNLELMKAGFPPIDIKFTDRLAYYNAFDA